MFPIYFNGQVRDVASIRPSEVTVADVAETLSKINRFAGRTPYPYSVAQHAVLCSHIVKVLDGSEEHQYEALHHDDTEAFIGDILGPLKKHLVYAKDVTWSHLERFGNVEDGIRRNLLAPAFKLSAEEPYACKQADALALRVEQVLVQGHDTIGLFPKELPLRMCMDLVHPMHWRAAQRAYEERHRELVP
jgi:5'-deoxynucleotidase YfbR-like HD superfamily hydrolase